MGEGIGMGNTCKHMAVSIQCMTKFTPQKQVGMISVENCDDKDPVGAMSNTVGVMSCL